MRRSFNKASQKGGGGNAKANAGNKKGPQKGHGSVKGSKDNTEKTVQKENEPCSEISNATIQVGPLSPSNMDTKPKKATANKQKADQKENQPINENITLTENKDAVDQTVTKANKGAVKKATKKELNKSNVGNPEETTKKDKPSNVNITKEELTLPVENPTVKISKGAIKKAAKAVAKKEKRLSSANDKSSAQSDNQNVKDTTDGTEKCAELVAEFNKLSISNTKKSTKRENRLFNANVKTKKGTTQIENQKKTKEKESGLKKVCVEIAQPGPSNASNYVLFAQMGNNSKTDRITHELANAIIKVVTQKEQSSRFRCSKGFDRNAAKVATEIKTTSIDELMAQKENDLSKVSANCKNRIVCGYSTGNIDFNERAAQIANEVTNATINNVFGQKENDLSNPLSSKKRNGHEQPKGNIDFTERATQIANNITNATISKLEGDNDFSRGRKTDEVGHGIFTAHVDDTEETYGLTNARVKKLATHMGTGLLEASIGATNEDARMRIRSGGACAGDSEEKYRSPYIVVEANPLQRKNIFSLCIIIEHQNLRWMAANAEGRVTFNLLNYFLHEFEEEYPDEIIKHNTNADLQEKLTTVYRELTSLLDELWNILQITAQSLNCLEFFQLRFKMRWFKLGDGRSFMNYFLACNKLEEYYIQDIAKKMSVIRMWSRGVDIDTAQTMFDIWMEKAEIPDKIIDDIKLNCDPPEYELRANDDIL